MDRVSARQDLGPRGRVDLVGVYLTRLVNELDREELRSLNETQRRVRLERRLGEIISVEGPVMSNHERADFIKRVVDESLGLGVLEPLLADESITEIMVNGPDAIYIERGGKVERHKSIFTSEAQLLQTIDRIVSRVNRRVDESSPMVDLRLATGERVNVIIPPLSVDGPVLTIRRFPRAYDMGDLVRMGTITQDVALLFAAFVRARFSILISGGTGTGKTTFLNALSGLIPDTERIITVEDVSELQLQQSHVVRLEARPPNVEGQGEVTIRDLVRNSLRMRPDRIVVGEVRGGETLDMLQAMNTGHAGSLTTVHANSAYDACSRLETLASMSGLDLPVEVLRDQVNGAIDVIAHFSRFHDGSRKLVEISALTSAKRANYELTPILTFEHEPLVVGRAVTGRFAAYPLPQALLYRLHASGESVPQAFQGVL
jgi:pilus assembly protein CpaF